MEKLKELLKLVWSKDLYVKDNLTTIGGEPISIINNGTPVNDTDDHGIDITGAVIEIDGTTYRGGIIVSPKSSDLKNMQTNSTSLYDNAILIVVDDADTIICRSDGSVIPTIELKFPDKIRETYRQLLNDSTSFGCASAFAKFKPIDRYAYITRLTIERLQRKHDDFKKLYNDSGENWYEAFYITLFGVMGAGSNKEAYIKLARTVPYNIITRLKDSVFDMEAILLGSSGLLTVQYPDEYTSKLIARFEELRKTFNIIPMRYNEWDLTSNKPYHHPVIRIVELAALFFSKELLFAQLMECRTPEQVRDVMSAEASPYWTNHFVPSTKSGNSIKRIGNTMMNIITINLVVPMIATYGKIYNNEALLERAIELLEKVPAEKNRYTIGWNSRGVDIENAFFSQGIIQLSREYCEKKRCTQCNIGENLFCFK